MSDLTEEELLVELKMMYHSFGIPWAYEAREVRKPKIKQAYTQLVKIVEGYPILLEEFKKVKQERAMYKELTEQSPEPVQVDEELIKNLASHWYCPPGIHKNPERCGEAFDRIKQLLTQKRMVTREKELQNGRAILGDQNR